MAYWIDDSIDIGNGRQITFFCDSESDVSNLPTATSMGVRQGNDATSCLPCGKGSRVLAIDTGTLYILNSSNSWVEVGGGGS